MAYTEEMVKDAIKNYNMMQYNKTRYGRYMFDTVNEDYSDDMFQNIKNSYEKLKTYPDEGQMLFDILYDSYIKQRKMRLRDVAKKNKLSPVTIWRKKEKAFFIILSEIEKEQLK